MKAMTISRFTATNEAAMAAGTGAVSRCISMPMPTQEQHQRIVYRPPCLDDVFPLEHGVDHVVGPHHGITATKAA